MTAASQETFATDKRSVSYTGWLDPSFGCSPVWQTSRLSICAVPFSFTPINFAAESVPSFALRRVSLIGSFYLNDIGRKGA